jgi:Na+-transporting methylmalonyl-CoA/oxaloacetate decarboxylase gamma subunit
MKRILIVLVALVAMVAFVGGAVAQEKKAPAPAPAAPAAEKAKADKPKAPKAMKASGTVAAYEAGKMIKVKGAKDKEWSFDIAPDAKVKGEVKEGAKVTVLYKKDGDKMVATSIAVAAAKKPKAPKKEMKEEKK